MIRIGIDLGGTKIEAIAIEDDGSERWRERLPTPAHDYEGTLEAVRRLVERIERDLGPAAGVGLGTPGAISLATGLVKNANSIHLNGRPFAADLERVLGRRLRMENDANCFALSEAVDGAGAADRVVFGVILGTGVGGGIVVDRQLWSGVNRIAGEWGHNELPSRTEAGLPRMACYCGRTGCIETYLSGPALARDHERATAERLSPPEIVARARAGDDAAAATIARYCNRLASALATVINILDPDAIVLGGGLSNIDELYEDVAPLLPRHVFSDRVVTRIARNRHGDSSGVRGAAWLWPAPRLA